MCLFPKIIKNPKYTATKKNGGIITQPKDPRLLGVPIGCGECIECMNKRKRDWQIRLTEEIKNKNNWTFVTLTFSNEAIKKYYQNEQICNLTGYEKDNAAATLAVRMWLERWRKKYKKSLKHWLCTELGHNGTENIHLHGLIASKDKETIKKTWQNGYVWLGLYVNSKTINYITKYISKQDFQHKAYKPKILTSAGIGKTYINNGIKQTHKYKPKETKDHYNSNGHKKQLPIYYRNKLFNEEERENLWIEKLDNNKRYVLGQEIDINKEGIEKYSKMQKEAQRKNGKLGYGSGHKKWHNKEYEEQRRTLLQEKRIKKTKDPKEGLLDCSQQKNFMYEIDREQADRLNKYNKTKN